MRVFVVSIGAGMEAYELAKELVREFGIESYADAEEFFPDGVQDPYRAVDEVDALVWIYGGSSGNAWALGMSDYNFLYADTIMQRAVRTGKPILYYYLKRDDTVDMPSPAIMLTLARRTTVLALPELEEKLREDLRDLVAGRIPFYNPHAPSIFLSYSHRDGPFVRQLQKDLQMGGARVWIDEGELHVGDWLIETIRNGIDKTDYFGVILSPDSVASRWVRDELDVAMNQEIDGQRVKVLPLLYRTCELPDFLEGRLYADFSEDYDRALHQVLRRLGLSDNVHVPA